MKSRFFLWVVLSTLPFLLISNNAECQQLTREEISKAAKQELPIAIQELRTFLSIPNNGNLSEQVLANLAYCKRQFEQLGFATETLTTPGEPLLFAEKIFDEKAPSVLFYLQIDGQPVDSSKWQQESPYLAALKANENGRWVQKDWSDLDLETAMNWRIFARSASDSKGPAMAFMKSLEIIQKKGIRPAYNVKVIMDFQEELGSPDLPELVKQRRDMFEAELLCIMDGTRHLSNLPTLTFGARGIATATIRVFGARRDLHSGQYGNFAPNPVFNLSRLLASMKDEEGRVLIPGYYNDIVLSEAEKKKMNDLPEDMDQIMNSLGIAQADKVGGTYQEALQYPSLNVRGLRAAWVGKEVRTLVPAEAIAEIDMRLVPETPGERQVALLKAFIQSKGYHLVDSIPSDEERSKYPLLASFKYRIGSKPFRTSFDSKAGLWLSDAMTHAFGEKGFVKMRTTGGSQPMAPFINTLGIDAVSIRIPNPDNCIHAPNENLRIGNFLEGIQMCLAILTQSKL